MVYGIEAVSGSVYDWARAGAAQPTEIAEAIIKSAFCWKLEFTGKDLSLARTWGYSAWVWIRPAAGLNKVLLSPAVVLGGPTHPQAVFPTVIAVDWRNPMKLRLSGSESENFLASDLDREMAELELRNQMGQMSQIEMDEMGEMDEVDEADEIDQTDSDGFSSCGRLICGFAVRVNGCKNVCAAKDRATAVADAGQE